MIQKALVGLLLFATPPIAESQPLQLPAPVSNERDGTIRDVASGPGLVAVALGGRVAFFDPKISPLTPRFMPEYTYPGRLKAIEWDRESVRIFTVVSRFIESSETPEDSIHFHDPRANQHHIAEVDQLDEEGRIQDIKYLPDHEVLVVLYEHGIALMDYSNGGGTQLHAAPLPLGMESVKRLALYTRAVPVQGSTDEYEIFALATGLLPGVNRLRDGFGMWSLGTTETLTTPTVIDLDSDDDCEIWDPADEFAGGPFAKPTVGYLQVRNDPATGQDLAFIACGRDKDRDPILAVLDITSPGPNLPSPTTIDLTVTGCTTPLDPNDPGVLALNIASNQDQSEMYVVTQNVLHVVDAATQTALRCRNYGIFDGGDKDMAFDPVPSDPAMEFLWMGVHQQVQNAIQGVNVRSTSLNPSKRRPWISSSDGAVAVPEYDSIYLPTFGGVVRYNLIGSDTTSMDLASFAYQGMMNGPTEHVDFLDVGGNQGFVVAANAVNGMQAYPVSAANPDPGSPFVVQPYGNTGFYTNDIATYNSPSGEHYVLTDVSANMGMASSIFTLEAFKYTPGAPGGDFLHHKSSSAVPSGVSGANGNVVEVVGHFAIVGGEGMVFVVDLDDLDDPSATELSVVQTYDISANYETCKGITCDGAHLFASMKGTPDAVLSFDFDMATGSILSQNIGLLSDGLGRPLDLSARLRRHPSQDILYATGNKGRLYIIPYDPVTGDLSTPEIFSIGQEMEMQDCRVYDLDNGPGTPTVQRILLVKNNESFVLLDPVGGQ